MRRVVSAVVAMTMLSAQPVLAQRQCSSLSDQSAFEVQALRSELMVLATGCHEDDRYNAFIRRFQAARQGTALGGDFCPRNGMIFNEVLALQSSTELADFAAGKDLVPTTVEICT